MVYGLENFISSLLEAMKKFLLDYRTTPTLIRADFDYKLIGGKVTSLLTDQHIKVESAPPYRQSQNGLVEQH
jgi:hypothetical protein